MGQVSDTCHAGGTHVTPVLGGLLIADEVIDVFLPVLYFAVQKRRCRKLRGISLLDELEEGREEPLSISAS
jgi:hypothetical protein